MKFSTKVMGILLTDNELYKLNEKAKWDEEKLDWQIPYFSFNHKSREVSFPTINAKQRADQLKEDRDLIIDENQTNPDREESFRKQGNFGGGTTGKKADPAPVMRKGGKSLADYNEDQF